MSVGHINTGHSPVFNLERKINNFNVKAATVFNVLISLGFIFSNYRLSVETHNAWRTWIHFKVRQPMTFCYISSSENWTISSRNFKMLFNINLNHICIIPTPQKQNYSSGSICVWILKVAGAVLLDFTADFSTILNHIFVYSIAKLKY